MVEKVSRERRVMAWAPGGWFPPPFGVLWRTISQAGVLQVIDLQLQWHFWGLLILILSVGKGKPLPDITRWGRGEMILVWAERKVCE